MKSFFGKEFWCLSFRLRYLHCKNYTEEERFYTKINIFMFGMKPLFFGIEFWWLSFRVHYLHCKTLYRIRKMFCQNQYLHVWYETFLLRDKMLMTFIPISLMFIPKYVHSFFLYPVWRKSYQYPKLCIWYELKPFWYICQQIRGFKLLKKNSINRT